MRIETVLGDRQENLKRALDIRGKKMDDLEADMRIIREWLKTQPHFPETPCDELIVSFLVMNKFSLEKTKKKLDMYYSLRSIVPALYVGRNPKLSSMKLLLDNYYFLPLPKLTKEGYRVTFIKVFGGADSIVMYDLGAHRFNMMEIRLIEDCVVGDIYVEDLSDVTLAHVMKLTPVIAKQMGLLFEKVYNNNMKQLHFTNVPSYFEVVISLIKQIINPKLAQRIYTHPSIKGLEKFFPLDIMPVEYGGQDYTLADLHEYWKKKISDFQDRFDVLETLRVDEKKRPTPLEDDDILGFHGSFKQLNMD